MEKIKIEEFIEHVYGALKSGVHELYVLAAIKSAGYSAQRTETIFRWAKLKLEAEKLSQ